MAEIPNRFRIGSFHSFSATPDSYVVEGICEFPKAEIGNLALFISSEEKRMTWAFRLAHPGCGAIRSVAYDFIGFVPESGRILPREELSNAGFSYQLSASIGEHLRPLWGDAFELSRQIEADAKRVPTHLRIGTNRYLASFGEKVAEHRLVDYVVGLEALCGREADAVSSYSAKSGHAYWKGRQ